METLHFRVDGVSILNIARDCVLSERWQYGVEILRQLGTDTGPMSYDDVYALLTGASTLSGDSDSEITIIPEAPEVREAYIESCRDVYGGRFYRRGHWWRPYATVTPGGTMEGVRWCQVNISRCAGRLLRLSAQGGLTSGGEWSATACCELETLSDSGVSRWPLARPLTVARRPLEDLVIFVEGPQGETRTIYLCEHCDAPPQWGARPGVWFPNLCGAELHLSNRCVPELSTHGDLSESEKGKFPPFTAQDQDVREQREQEAYAAFLRQCAEIRSAVRAAVGPEDSPNGDWLTLRHGNHVFRVPGPPFRRWAIGRTLNSVKLSSEAQERLRAGNPWAVCSPSGLKLFGDDPYHTDWLLGGLEVTDTARDLDIQKDYATGGALNQAAYERVYQMESTILLQALSSSGLAQSSADTYHCLTPGGNSVEGIVVHPTEDGEVPPGSIVLLPNAGAEWAVTALSATGVIVEIGGALAHVVQVNVERDIPVFRVPDARARWPEGTRLRLNGHGGLIISLDGERV